MPEIEVATVRDVAAAAGSGWIPSVASKARQPSVENSFALLGAFLLCVVARRGCPVAGARPSPPQLGERAARRSATPFSRNTFSAFRQVGNGRASPRRQGAISCCGKAASAVLTACGERVGAL